MVKASLLWHWQLSLSHHCHQCAPYQATATLLVEKYANPSRVVYCATCLTLTSKTTKFEISISIYSTWSQYLTNLEIPTYLGDLDILHTANPVVVLPCRDFCDKLFFNLLVHWTRGGYILDANIFIIFHGCPVIR